MQTFISEEVRATPEGEAAQEILRKCVHCGFCTATCPTYQLKGDELDSPRGRIYLIKGLFEGKLADEKTRMHLDRCLTCRSCETTCPSGVDYGHLIDLGREKIEKDSPTKRPISERITRRLLREVLPYPKRFSFLLGCGRLVKPLLPKVLSDHIPVLDAPVATHTIDRASLHRKMLVLEGCVQPTLQPGTNHMARNVLAKLGIDLISANEAGCCGAVDQHLAAADTARDRMRRNIDAWWPLLEDGAEAIVITASGCGSLVKEYAYHLKDDAAYAAKAEKVSGMTRDLLEVIEQEDLTVFMQRSDSEKKIACQIPCSLQHGQQLGGRLEALLTRLGFAITPVKDAHLCCGSAGTYSILQKEMAAELRENKLENLQKNQPDVIVSANIGCQSFLSEKADVPVKHWIALLAD